MQVEEEEIKASAFAIAQSTGREQEYGVDNSARSNGGDVDAGPDSPAQVLLGSLAAQDDEVDQELDDLDAKLARLEKFGTTMMGLHTTKTPFAVGGTIAFFSVLGFVFLGGFL